MKIDTDIASRTEESGVDLVTFLDKIMLDPRRKYGFSVRPIMADGSTEVMIQYGNKTVEVSGHDIREVLREALDMIGEP